MFFYAAAAKRIGPYPGHGIFLVTLFHAFLYNGYYGQPQVGFAMWSAGVARSLSMACNGLFMTLTGYLHYGKRSLSGAVRGLGPVLLGYALAAAFSIPVRHFLLGQQESLSVWVTRFFGFRGSITAGMWRCTLAWPCCPLS